MKESDPTSPNGAYWHHDVPLDLSGVTPQPDVPLHLRIHESLESSHSRSDIVPLTHSRGRRRYFHGQLYVPEPNISLTIALLPRPQSDRSIGRVVATRETGWSPREIGQAQAWSYPQDQTLVLWECFLHDRYQTEPPLEDALLTAFWRNWEEWLRGRCPDTRLIATPAWEPLYSPDHWQEFLESRGYGPYTKRAFAKTVLEK